MSTTWPGLSATRLSWLDFQRAFPLRVDSSELAERNFSAKCRDIKLKSLTYELRREGKKRVFTGVLKGSKVRRYAFPKSLYFLLSLRVSLTRVFAPFSRPARHSFSPCLAATPVLHRRESSLECVFVSSVVDGMFVARLTPVSQLLRFSLSRFPLLALFNPFSLHLCTEIFNVCTSTLGLSHVSG